MHGIVTSYEQVASSTAFLARLSRDLFVVFDELHHAADDRAWGAHSRRRTDATPLERRLTAADGWLVTT